VTRILSAGVLLALVIGTLWFLPTWATAGFAILAAVLGAAEIAAMSGHAGAPIPAVFLSSAAAVVTVAFLCYGLAIGPGAEGLSAVLVALVLTSATLTLAAGPPSPATLTRAGLMAMAPLYVGIPLGALSWVQMSIGPGATSWLLAIIAVSDSAQYYTGRAFGQRPLAPVVSPKKTREGAIGGVVIATIAGFLLGPLWLPQWSAAQAAGLAAALASFGIVGDLFESLLKRSAGMKDSSHLIPGHGGVLDRIDSHLFAAPVFFVVVRQFS
jgi:phosphatidate cytidylyltransferase